MEHIYDIIPNPVRPAIDIDCVTAIEYDGGPFLRYHIRLGFNNVSESVEAHYVKSSRSAHCFLQRWLWFGLLQEALGPLYQGPQEWIRHDSEGNKLLCTKGLDQRLQHRRDKMSKTEHEDYCEHMLICLTMLEKMENQCFYDTRHDAFDDGIVLTSIALLAELIEASTTMSSDDPQLKACRPGVFWPGIIRKTVDMSMIDSGWRPADVSRIAERISVKFYFYCMKKIDSLDHSKCVYKCLASRATKEMVSNPAAKHVHDSCACPRYYADHSLFASIIKRNRLPIVTVHGADSIDSMQIEISESDASTPYVAISHVWTDGLGDPKSNALPYCQLARLQRYVSQLALPASDASNGADLFQQIVGHVFGNPGELDLQ